MKNIVPATKGLPVIPVVDLVGKILSHTANMDRIKKEYKIAKLQMNQKYKLERKHLEQDMEKFHGMLQLQKEYFNVHHEERMQLLKSIDKISKALCKRKDIYAIKALNESLNMLLSIYSRNQQQNVGFIENREFITNKGER